jgi:hypothetical protein
LTDPARRKAIILKRKKNFKFIKEIPIPKSKFSFLFPKKFRFPGAWLSAAWNSEPRVKKRHCVLLSDYSGGLICVRMRTEL